MPKEEKKEYGKPVACRLQTKDYLRFEEVAKARGLRRSTFAKQIIEEYLQKIADIEAEYVKYPI